MAIYIGKQIQENIFMRFCCFKLAKKLKLLSELLTHTTAKCTLTGLVQ